MLIAESEATGNTGEDKEAEVDVKGLLESFQGQDSYQKELNKGIPTATNNEDEVDDDWENFLSKVDREWLNIDNK